MHQELVLERYEHFTPNDIADAILELKNGKTQGLDNLYAEHMKNASDNRGWLLIMMLSYLLLRTVKVT